MPHFEAPHFNSNVGRRAGLLWVPLSDITAIVKI